MSVLTTIEKNFNYLYTKQNELDKLLAKVNLSIREQQKKNRLKEEISNILSDILSLQCNDVLSTSFYMQVNSIEQEIYNLLDSKKEVLNKLNDKKNNIYKIANKIFPIIYSIDILQNSVHIKVDVEKRLLDLKNTILNYETNKKQLIAIKYLSKKTKAYEEGLIKLVDLIKNYELKQELSFEIKQEIFEIFSNISLNIQNDVNHTKVFNESIISNEAKYTHEYILWYENLFIDMFKDAGLLLPSFYNQIRDIQSDKSIISAYTNKFINFIYRNYVSEINLYIKKLEKNIVKYKSDIELQLGFCYSYDRTSDMEEILNKIQKEKILPSYLLSSNSKELLKYILFDLDISFDNNMELYNILDDLHKCICQVFDNERYIDMYKFNMIQKPIQIAQYRQYYIDVLDEAKEKIISEYINKIDTLIENENLEDCSTSELMNKINNLSNDVKKLEEALEFINKNYRSFGNENLKKYIETIQKRYELFELYQNVVEKKAKFIYKIKAKVELKKESNLIYEFANKKGIKDKLTSELLNDIFKDDNSLKNEVISLIKSN